MLPFSWNNRSKGAFSSGTGFLGGDGLLKRWLLLETLMLTDLRPRKRDPRPLLLLVVLLVDGVIVERVELFLMLLQNPLILLSLHTAACLDEDRFRMTMRALVTLESLVRIWSTFMVVSVWEVVATLSTALI